MLIKVRFDSLKVSLKVKLVFESVQVKIDCSDLFVSSHRRLYHFYFPVPNFPYHRSKGQSCQDL